MNNSQHLVSTFTGQCSFKWIVRAIVITCFFVQEKLRAHLSADFKQDIKIREHRKQPDIKKGQYAKKRLTFMNNDALSSPMDILDPANHAA